MLRITQAEIEAMRARGYDISTIANAEAWLAATHRADELIAVIEEAFRDVKLEEGTGLRESSGIDDYACGAELQRLRASDEKEDWRKIDSELISQCHAAPSFLNAQGMYFHLPAFLTAELRGNLSIAFMDRLIFNGFGDPDFVLLLKPQQRLAVKLVLEFFMSLPAHEDWRDDVLQAIQRFAD